MAGTAGGSREPLQGAALDMLGSAGRAAGR